MPNDDRRRLRLARDAFDRRNRANASNEDVQRDRLVAEIQRELAEIQRDLKKRDQQRRTEQGKQREQSKRRNERSGLTNRSEKGGFAQGVKARVSRATSNFANPLKALGQAVAIANVIDELISRILRNEDFVAELVLKVVEEVVKTVTLQRAVQTAVEQGNERLRDEILSTAFLNDLAARLAQEPAFQREAARVAASQFDQTEAFRRIADRSAREVS